MDAHSEARYFLWQGQALYIGRGGVAKLHQHHMIQIGISFDKPIKIRQANSEKYERYQTFVINSDVPHQTVAAGRVPVIFLWLDPESNIGQHIQKTHFTDAQITTIDPQKIEPVLANLSEMALGAHQCDQASFVLKMILQILVPTLPGSVTSLDPRIQHIIKYIKTLIQQADKLSVEQLAETAHLSPSRLMHLFRDQLGLPIRRYILWQRLLTALQAMAEGQSLTEAAHQAGFADSAHLTRTFHMMSGIKPSEMLKNSRFVQVISCYPS